MKSDFKRSGIEVGIDNYIEREILAPPNILTFEIVYSKTITVKDNAKKL